MKNSKKLLALGLALGLGCGLGLAKEESHLTYNPVKISYAAEKVNPSIIKKIKDIIERSKVKLAGIEFIKEKMPETTKRYESVINAAVKEVEASIANAEAYLAKIEGNVEKPEKPNPNYTTEQAAAIKKAKEINKEAAYSRQALIWELEDYRFSREVATFAVDNSGIDYNTNAARSAKSLLEYDYYSKDGLISRLKGLSYNESEAIKAANKYDKDEFWIGQAVGYMEKEYPEYSDGSNNSFLISKLKDINHYTLYQTEEAIKRFTNSN